MHNNQMPDTIALKDTQAHST